MSMRRFGDHTTTSDLIRRRAPSGVLAGLVASILLIAAFAAASNAPPTASAAGGTFPNEPWNGMQISYGVEGAELWSPLDDYDFTTSRTYHGRVLGPVLRVSGSVNQTWGYGASLRVSVQAGGESNSFESSGETPWSKDFDVSVQVPPGTTTGSVSVFMTGDYSAGTRGLVVRAELDNNAPTDTPNPTDTPTPTPTPAYDLNVGDIEITQVIQCLDPAQGAACADNSVDLVRGKRTVVRVYPIVDAPDPANRPRDGEPVTAKLELVGGSGSPLAPVNQALLWEKSPREQRTFRDLTLNFVLPADWSKRENATLKVTINPDRSLPETDYDNNSKEIALAFKERRTLKVRYHPVRVLDGLKKVSPDAGVYRTAHRIMQQWFPIRDAGVTYMRGTRLTYWTAFDSLVAAPPYVQTSALLKWFDRQAAIPRLLGSKVDQTVAWIVMPPVQGGYWYGLSDPPWMNPPGRGHSVLMRSYASAQYGLAHEVAHNLGARHPNREPSGCGALDNNTDWPYADASIQEVGYDAWAGVQGRILRANAPDLMSYCADNKKWMSPHTYTVVQGGLAPRAVTDGNGLTALQQPRDLAVVSGTLYRDGRAEIDPLVRISGVDDEPTPPSSGPYCVEIGGGSGTQERRCFEVDFLDPDQHSVDSETYLFVVPVPTGADAVRLSRSGGALAERRASANAPTLRIVEPAPGAAWDGPRTVRWSAADADGDALTFTLAYSHDGATWQTLNADLEGSELEVDFNDLPGSGDARVRVWASDGFRTTVADAGPFLVPAKPPRPMILQPEDGTTIGLRDTLALTGSGDDPEDGEIDEETYQWSSDRDGPLGTGATVDVDGLTEGTHLIRLSARDADGQTGFDTVFVHVQPSEAFMPLVLRHAEPASSIPIPMPTATHASHEQMARDLVALVSRYRTRRGLGPLDEVGMLTDAAAWYADDLGSGDYLDPDGYDRLDRDAEARARAFGYGQGGYVTWRVAEGVTRAGASAQSALDALMSNAVDRSNLLDPHLCHAGAGYAPGNGGATGHVWVLDLGCRDAAVPTPPATRIATATETRAVSSATATATTEAVSPTPTATWTQPRPGPTVTPGTAAPPTPFATPRPGLGIQGRVTYAGAPAEGVFLSLVHETGGTGTERYLAQTDEIGRYAFASAASIPAGDFYYVRYENADDDRFVSRWYGPDIRGYVAGQDTHGGDFDIANVSLLSPEGGMSMFLPTEFRWERRAFGAHSYNWTLYDQESGRRYTSDAIGDTDTFTLAALPEGFSYDQDYWWSLRIHASADSFGVPYYMRRVRFTRSAGPPEWQEVFSDDFCDAGSGWPSGDDAAVRYGYVIDQDCTYQILHRNSGRSLWVTPSRDVAGTFRLTAAGSATGTGAYGITFGATPSRDRAYVFLLLSDRRYGLFRYANNAWEALTQRTSDPRIDPDFGNTLSVVNRGTAMELYLDGELLTTVDDGRTHDGQFGVYAEGGAAGYDARWSWVRVETDQ